jgi:DNA-directed RNA polymerase specialized sigma24 family protein
MSNAGQSASVSLHALAQQCAQETQRFFQHGNEKAQGCLELFQRAMISRQEEAWNYIYQQYEGQVRRWVQRHSMFGMTGETADYFVNLAFMRMWQAITPEKFARFSAINEIMRYLQMCVHSVIVDYLRARPRLAVSIEDASDQGMISTATHIATTVLDKVYQTQVWNMIGTRIRNQKEKIVLNCFYALDMKPREIYEEYPQIFRDVKEIYRIKENILARLRRDKELQALFAENAGKPAS